MITSAHDIPEWLRGRLPGGWFTGMTVTTDREEILIVGEITDPEATSPAAQAGRIRRFREDTRGERISIAKDLESLTGLKVSWGVTCGGTTTTFTRLSVPVMTRLAQAERIVLDTLVEAGVARSRSDALAWCVRQVGQHQGEWLAELDDAMAAVRDVRERGPNA